MAPTVERQVKITLSEEEVKQIISDHINENKSKYGVKEVFRAENVSINVINHPNRFHSVTALSKSKEKL